MPGRTSCVASNYSDFELPDNDVLVEVTQVMQPVCSTLTTFDITGKQFSNGFKFFLNSYAESLLTAEDFWFFCDLYLQFITPINLWNKCIDLRLFLKWTDYKISRSQPQNSTSNVLWPQMASKTSFPNISKVASNQCIGSKDRWEVWIVGPKVLSNEGWTSWHFKIS